MGETNENYARGHKAFSEGRSLHLGIDLWSQEMSDYADGWLAAAKEWAEHCATSLKITDPSGAQSQQQEQK